jgi:hypothetical protein
MTVVMRSFLCTAAVLLLVARAETDRDSARAFLASSFGISSDELDTIDGGHVVARTLAVRDPREVTTLGVVRLRVTPEFYVERLADIVNFKRTDGVLQIGRFGNPPDMHDVADLTVDEWDVGKLRDCRVGDCGVQLSAEAIERFRTGVDWRRADVQLQSSRLMRQILLEYVTDYRNMGAAGSMEYADRTEPVNTGREFAILMDDNTGPWQHFGDLRRHLLGYPNAQAAETGDIIYWSKERTGRRAVISVTHLAISRSAADAVEYAIASKQIYGAHYFDASLGLTALLPDRTVSAPAMYLVYLNRSRVDLFKGTLGGMARRIVGTRARSVVFEQLGRLKQTMERQFSAQENKATVELHAQRATVSRE